MSDVWCVEALAYHEWLPLALFDSHVQAAAYALQFGLEQVRIIKSKEVKQPSVKDWSPRSRTTA